MTKQQLHLWMLPDGLVLSSLVTSESLNFQSANSPNLQKGPQRAGPEKHPEKRSSLGPHPTLSTFPSLLQLTRGHTCHPKEQAHHSSVSSGGLCLLLQQVSQHGLTVPTLPTWQLAGSGGAGFWVCLRGHGVMALGLNLGHSPSCLVLFPALPPNYQELMSFAFPCPSAMVLLPGTQPNMG